jgi:C4-dicarboxylate-specific signal transduction histidine kinase
MTGWIEKQERMLGGWGSAIVIFMFSLIAMAAVIGLLGYQELRDIEAPRHDASWTIQKLDLEHNRLVYALETNAAPDEIKLRGEIYLNQVAVIRDAPALEQVRRGLSKDKFQVLLDTAETTSNLLPNVADPAVREELRQRLRWDAEFVREFTIGMISVERSQQIAERSSSTHSLLIYMIILELLVVALIVPALLMMRIAERLQTAEVDLASQIATQNAILNTADDAILGLDPQGRVLYSNQRALALLGPAAERGAAVTEEGQRDGLLRPLAELASTSEPPDRESTPVTRRADVEGPDGIRHYLLRRFPGDSDGTGSHGVSALVTIVDVTEEQEAALRREEYDARLAEIGRLLAYAAISGGIVHEISQPLAAIRNYAYALKVSFKLHNASEEQIMIADNLGQEIDRAVEVVRNVRRLGPQDTDESGVCDVREAIEHAVRLVTMGNNPPPPITVIAEERSLWVNGSLPLVGQVLVNLLKNALSASAAAGRPGAEVTVAARNDAAEIVVIDYGDGVSEDAASSLFAPFSKSARGGMGLGLAICQRIASTLGGSLSWRNRENSGAVFTFSVPLAEEGNVP